MTIGTRLPIPRPPTQASPPLACVSGSALLYGCRGGGGETTCIGLGPPALLPCMCSELPLSCLSSFAFVDLGSVQKVALAVQELNGRFFHKRKLYVNSNRSCPKTTPDMAERPQELPVCVPPLRALVALHSLSRAWPTWLSVHPPSVWSYCGAGGGLDEIRPLL